MQWSKYKNIQTLLVLYLLSNLLLILNTEGIYWDDWVLYHHHFDVIETMFNQVTGKAHLLEYIHYALGRIGNGIASYRIATVIVYGLSGLFLYSILLDIKSISRTSAFYITLIFMILPVNSARIALIDFPYGLLLCVFFMAFWMLSIYINKQNTNKPIHFIFRLMILALFYLSFFINSLLIFYVIVLLYILYKNQMLFPDKTRLYAIKLSLIKNIDFICLPLVFFYVKVKFFVPYGLYENYNAVTFHYVLYNILPNLKLSVTTSFYAPLIQTSIVSLHHPLLFSAIMIFVYLLLRKDKLPEKSERLSITIGLGLFFFILAVFPYIAVGKIPSLYRLDSRHMLLIPLGFSLCLYSFILLLKHINSTLSRVVLLGLLSSCILKNVYDQSQYLKDWFYQIALEENYKDNRTIKNNTTFIFNSNLTLAENRSIQFYEHNGRFRKIFGNDTRFMGDNLHEIETYASYKQYKQYNFSNWNMSDPIMINVQKRSDVTSKTFLSLLFYMLTDDTAFRHKAKNLITLDVAQNNE